MSSRPPHMGYILNPDLLQRSSFRGHYNTDRLGLGMSKAEIKAKHPPGTSPKHINAMHQYMTKDGLSFQQAHNKAEASDFPALGNTGLGHCNCAVPSCPSCNNRMGRTIGMTENLPIEAITAWTAMGLVVHSLLKPEKYGDFSQGAVTVIILRWLSDTFGKL